MERPAALPSFHELEESVRKYVCEQRFHTNKRCKSPMCTAPSAKKRKIDSFGHTSDNSQSAFVPTLDAYPPSGEVQLKNESDVTFPAEPKSRFNLIRVQDIINPVGESVPRQNTSSKVTDEAIFAPYARNLVSQTPNDMIDSPSMRPGSGQESLQAYSPPSLPFQRSLDHQLQEQNGYCRCLDGYGNLMNPSSKKDKTIFAPGSFKSAMQNGHKRKLSTPQPINTKPRSQSKVLRWNNEEHFWFLLGYEKLGKKWSLISGIIQTRTTLQVQSHAQKFFNRMKNDDKKKSTIHDLTLESKEMQGLAAGIGADVKEARLAIAKCKATCHGICGGYRHCGMP